jgi:hypothetical protein
MGITAVEVAVLMNRLARAAQHLARANEELREIEVRVAQLVKDVNHVGV